ncbi:MAG TPA: hydantoinase/oxoprolinase family protein [Sphingomonadaceae bacterium]|nr:hydantoinase/oxoprolinase family protein [Sphingomonadaceae bacterium]
MGTRYSVAVDIGGTFTDLVAFDHESGRVVHAKSLTTTPEFSRGVWDCLGKAGINSPECATLIHGSTVAINIAIEETGAKSALIVTRGTRDVYKIGRQNRPEAYNFMFQRPKPLVPRSRTLEVEERLSADGETLIALEDDEIERIAALVEDVGAEAAAICLLHSYANPAHEARIAERLRTRLGGRCYITPSHEIVREYREYERISTTVMNAYIGPKTSAYVERMETRLAEEGFDGRFLIMQSNGGVMAPETAKRLPVAMMESGPVGGVIGSLEVARTLGYENIITFDMGGTTAKTSLIKGGEISVAQGYFIGGYASGHPVMFPVVDIVEVGSGGGSIAWIDEVGALKLGPQSASSTPGPICYRRGGTEPTVTDANVALGRIGANSFLGGEMPLDVDAAIAGCGKLGSGLGLSDWETALGILQIATSKMALAVRAISVERGYDPRDFVMVATGGGGPPHAVQIARELRIPTVIIPNLPAHFSALGMLMADVRHDYVRTYFRALDEADYADIAAIYRELEQSGRAALDSAGVDDATHRYDWSMDLRYRGQEFWLQIPVTREDIAAGDTDAISRRFNETHKRRFSHAALEEPLELVNLRLVATGERTKPEIPVVDASGADGLIGTRPIHFDGSSRSVDCPIYRREHLAVGARITGPCVVEEYASTTLLHAGDALSVAPTGELVIEVGA